jgi:hypothetical protein
MFLHLTPRHLVVFTRRACQVGQRHVRPRRRGPQARVDDARDPLRVALDAVDQSGRRSRRIRRRILPPRAGAGIRPGARGILETVNDPSANPAEDVLRGLSDAERRWALHSEQLWRKAWGVARRHPTIDASDVYHALRCLELQPAERLRRGLSRGRLRAHAR